MSIFGEMNRNVVAFTPAGLKQPIYLGSPTIDDWISIVNEAEKYRSAAGEETLLPPDLIIRTVAACLVDKDGNRFDRDEALLEVKNAPFEIVMGIHREAWKSVMSVGTEKIATMEGNSEASPA